MTDTTFTCSDASGTYSFKCGALPTTDDMNTIIGCVAEDDADFLRICELSTNWPAGLTCEQFHAAALAS